jgi:hypothetical protein
MLPAAAVRQSGPRRAGLGVRKAAERSLDVVVHRQVTPLEEVRLRLEGGRQGDVAVCGRRHRVDEEPPYDRLDDAPQDPLLCLKRRRREPGGEAFADPRRARLAWLARALCLGTVLLCTAAPPVRGDGLAPQAAIARDGFGDARNSYAWSMAWFKGALYVGTARSAMCVENATIAYYLPDAGFYRREPLPGVTCPSTVARADLRAEIWRYEPGVGRWTRVYRSPRVPNPRAPGRLVARDIGYRGMLVRTERGGHKALYVAAFSPDEFIPELRRQRPPRILRTTDGERFRALRARPPVIHTYLGPYRPVGFRALATVGRSLYVTASAGLTGDGVVLRVRRPGGRSPSFEQVSPRKLAVFELATFGGRLYAGTGDRESGYGVWRADPHRPSRWESVVVGGAGRGSTITSVVSMAPYRGRLYVGASGWLNAAFPASELIRVARDGRWEVVVGNARRDVDGVLRSPLSGLPDGFGNAFNHHFWRMQAFRGALLLGTNDWSWSLRGAPGIPDQVRSEFGFDLYGTCDGVHWWVATRDGFGRNDDFGVRTMAVSHAGLFIGTTNNKRGTSIYRSRARPCAEAATPAVPSARPVYALPPNARRTLERERVRSDPSSPADGSETQR